MYRSWRPGPPKAQLVGERIVCPLGSSSRVETKPVGSILRIILAGRKRPFSIRAGIVTYRFPCTSKAMPSGTPGKFCA